MRRVAPEIGAGTMTLYHYVRNEDELIDLMDDAIMGEVMIPPRELSSAGARRSPRRAPLARGLRSPSLGPGGAQRCARRPTA